MDARLDLEMNARRYLDEEDITNADLRRLDDAGVMKRIVLKLAPEAKLDGKNPEQIRARYDAEVERAPAFTMEAARDMALGKLGGGGGSGSGGGQRQDGRPKDPRAAYLQRLDEQAKGGKKQATGAK